LLPILFDYAFEYFRAEEIDLFYVAHSAIKIPVTYLEIRSSVENERVRENGDRLTLLLAKYTEARHIYSEAADTYHKIGLLEEEARMRDLQDEYETKDIDEQLWGKEISKMKEFVIHLNKLSESETTQIIEDVKEQIRTRLSQIND